MIWAKGRGRSNLYGHKTPDRHPTHEETFLSSNDPLPP